MRRLSLHSLFLHSCFIVMLVSSSALATTPVAWRESTDEGLKAYKANNLAQAKSMFALAIKDALADRFNWEQQAESWGQLGVVSLESGDLGSAESAFKKALEVDEKLPDNQIAVGQCFERLGLLYFKRGQFADAERNFRRAQSDWINTLPATSPRLALINEYVAEACIKNQKYDEAAEAAKAALDIRQAGAKSLSASKTAEAELERCLALCLRIAIKKNDFVEADALLKKSGKSGLTKEGIAMQILNGDLYVARGADSKAVAQYVRALAAAKRHGIATPQVLNCARRLQKMVKDQREVAKELAAFTPEELSVPGISSLELPDLGRPEIAVPFGKDELDGTWQVASTSDDANSHYQLKWNPDTQAFDTTHHGRHYKVLVKSFDGRNIKLEWNSTPDSNFEGTFDGTYEGNSFKATNSKGTTLDGTRVSSARRERRDNARAAVIAQAKKTAEEQEQARKVAHEVDRLLREREAARAAEAQTAAGRAAEIQAAAAARAAAARAAIAPVNRPVKDKWALVVGISKFDNPRYNLRFAAKDAKDFANFLVHEAGFKEDHVRILLDDNATRKNIMSSFGSKWLPSITEPDDLVVVYISTHGTPAQKDRDSKNYIVAFDTEADDPYATGVDMEEIYRRLTSGVKSDRVLIVMDTCYSGGSIPGSRGLEESDNFDLSKLSVGAGHIVLSSSGVGERSWESKERQNGVFTRNLIDVLRENGTRIDATKTFSELRRRVQWEVKRDFSREQTPQLGGSWEGRDLVLSVQPIAPRSAGTAATEGLSVPEEKSAPASGSSGKSLPVKAAPTKATSVKSSKSINENVSKTGSKAIKR
ncbi:MAG: caspase family protein [Candidatus Obscuribacterales bacterium]|nr:caspase family protein [Candidatus Obscuribacterales bacterium]